MKKSMRLVVIIVVLALVLMPFIVASGGGVDETPDTTPSHNSIKTLTRTNGKTITIGNFYEVQG